MIMKTLLFLSALLISNAAMSATSGTLLLSATVPRIVSILVTPAPVSSALDLSVTQTNLKIGVVNEKSNSRTGYKGSVRSANRGKLKRTDGSEVLPYSLSISGAVIDLSTAAGSSYFFYNTQLYDTNRDMFISYTGQPAESMVEGIYNDTLTFEISAI